MGHFVAKDGENAVEVFVVGYADLYEGAGARVENGAVDDDVGVDLAVRDEDRTVFGVDNDGVAQGDFLDGTCYVSIELDEVANAEGLTDDDEQATDEVGQRFLGGKTDGSRHDACTGEDGGAQFFHAGDEDEDGGDGDDVDDDLDNALEVIARRRVEDGARALGHFVEDAVDDEQHQARHDDDEQHFHTEMQWVADTDAHYFIVEYFADIHLFSFYYLVM